MTKHFCPADWSDLTVGNVVEFSGGSQPPKSTFIHEPREGYIRLIQIRDYKTDDYPTYVPIEMARKFCSSNDIMIGRYGPPIFQILRGLEGAYNVALIKAIPNLEKIDQEYLYYFLQNETLFKYIDNLSQRTSGQTGIDMDALKEYPLPLPPLDEQRRIAEILSTWDEAIMLTEALIEALQRRKQALMQRLLTGEVRFPGFEGEWTKAEIGSYIDMLTGFPFSSEGYQAGGVKILRGTNITTGQMRWDEERTQYWTEISENLKKYLLEVGDIVIGMDGSLVGRNYAQIDSTDIPSLLVQRVARIRTLAGLVQEYLYQNFGSTDFIRYVDKVKTVTAIPHISGEDIRKFEINLPFDKEEQEKIADILSLCDHELGLMEEYRALLQAQKKGLMQQLLTGQVRV